MAQWGRGGAALAAADLGGSRRYGQRSVLFAVIAFVVGVAALILWVNVPKDVPDEWQDITTYTFMAAFFGLAPILHLIGFIYALFAVFRAGESRALGVLGLILNSISVLGGLGYIYAAAMSMGRFT